MQIKIRIMVTLLESGPGRLDAGAEPYEKGFRATAAIFLVNILLDLP